MDSFIEYHLCVDDVVETESLLSFFKSNPDIIYINTGYESTPQKGNHIHSCILFANQFTSSWTKSLERHRKKLNFIKKQSTNGKCNNANGWYFRRAKTDNNLAYVMKRETKTKDNDEWYAESVTPEQKTLINAYKEKSLDAIEKHNISKNSYTQDIIAYVEARCKRASKKQKKQLSTNEYIFEYYVKHKDKMPPPNISRICNFVKFKMGKINTQTYMGILGIFDNEIMSGYDSTDIDTEDDISDGEDHENHSTPPTVEKVYKPRVTPMGDNSRWD